MRCANRCASLLINNFKNLLCAITRAFYVFREKCASRFVVHISFIVCEKKYVQVVYHVRLRFFVHLDYWITLRFFTIYTILILIYNVRLLAPKNSGPHKFW